MSDPLRLLFTPTKVPARDLAFELRVLEAVEHRRFRRQVALYLTVAMAILGGSVFLTPLLWPVLTLPGLPVFLSVIGVLPGIILAGTQVLATQKA
ncbi:hypothetical protein [Asticcacaulis excentricus]|uniref:Uncharacterized protein n=1 Tax=Asticcacaulis excentricus (strain ATCC 15261 / DSM 4724 / KCTC 12464 / NCIMB 9791 / VKM B-1370 / CB 48) TaxID=573065 RepID=E8RM51_ASTEC|nr:hypothetical protein [Asticcacaulis excentricus]ADU12743.1 hypothetical protein Astex_1065 [Asticcacaulis excentricus CB 48]